jgi:hypothetical protein
LTTSTLPGGNYSVYATYPGDGTFSASDSSGSPIAVHINPEASKTFMAIVTLDANGNVLNPNATSVTYGSAYILRVDVTNNAGTPCSTHVPPTIGCPTGKVTLTDSVPNGGLSLTSPTNLNNLGFLEDQPIQLIGGTHTLPPVRRRSR